MDALTRWCLYILTAYATIVAVLVVCAFAVGWLTRGVWRRTKALIEHTLGPRGEDGAAATQEIELRAHPVYVGRRRREHRYTLSDSYINGEDLR